MMRNMFNRFNGGNKGDFTREDLPSNRWQLFFSMLKLNFWKLATANFYFLLFFVPMYIWVFTLNFNLLNQFITAGDTDMVASTVVTMVYGIAVCLLLLGPGLVGLTQVTRNMARDEHVWVTHDFFGAIKTNWKQMLAVSVINAALVIFSYVAVAFYSALAADMGMATLFTVFKTIVIAIDVLWCMMNIYIWPLMVTYDAKMGEILKSALVLAVGRLPQTVFMAVIILILPVLYLFVASQLVFVVVMVLFLLAAFAVISLAVNSVTNGIFDRYINIKIKGARINQGLNDDYAAQSEEGEDGHSNG